MRLDRSRADRALRRAAPAFGIGVMLLLLAIPAVFDLRSLFIGTGLVVLVVAVLIVAFTYADKPAAGRPDRP